MKGLQERNDYVLYLDAGHGGWDEKNGCYATNPLMGKKFRHEGLRFMSMPDYGDTFYEGVFNRLMVKEIVDVASLKGIQTVVVSHAWKDISLDSRSNSANQNSAKLKKVKRQGNLFEAFFSIHADAHSDTKANGFAAWTTKGQNISDNLASRVWEAVAMAIPHKHGLRMRSQNSPDGDPDYEKNFSVIRKAAMWSVLFECAFFTNLEDAQRMNNAEFRHDLAVAIVQGLCNFWGLN
jgi:N-acetylmuramoyl-L-alanine amidase